HVYPFGFRPCCSRPPGVAMRRIIAAGTRGSRSARSPLRTRFPLAQGNHEAQTVDLVPLDVQPLRRPRRLARHVFEAGPDCEHLAGDLVAVALQRLQQLTVRVEIELYPVADVEPGVLAGVLDEPDDVARQPLQAEIGCDLGAQRR